MPGDLCTAHSIIPFPSLSLVDRRDWCDTRAKWILAWNPDRSWLHPTLHKAFWLQPMVFCTKKNVYSILLGYGKNQQVLKYTYYTTNCIRVWHYYGVDLMFCRPQKGFQEREYHILDGEMRATDYNFYLL